MEFTPYIWRGHTTYSIYTLYIVCTYTTYSVDTKYVVHALHMLWTHFIWCIHTSVTTWHKAGGVQGIVN